MLKSTDTAEAGLNYAKLEVSLTAESAKKVERQLSKSKKDKSIVLKAGDDGNRYLPVGNYSVEMTTPAGVKEVFSLEIKSAKKENREDETASPEMD